MSNIDSELARKLQSRRSVVDSEGTQWVASEDQVKARQAQAEAAAKARAFFQPRYECRQSSGSLLAEPPQNERALRRPSDPADSSSTERGAVRRSVGSIDSELVQKLQERRGVVDSKGSAWLNKPEQQIRKSRTEPFSSGKLTAEDLSGQAKTLERHGIKLVDDGQDEEDKAEEQGKHLRGSVDGFDSELVRKLQTRRDVVDSEGSAWQSVPEAAKAAAGFRERSSSDNLASHSHGPISSTVKQAHAPASLQAVQRDSDEAGLTLSPEARASIESVHDAELAQKLSVRRSVVDSQGSAWQTLPAVKTAVPRRLDSPDKKPSGSGKSGASQLPPLPKDRASESMPANEDSGNPSDSQTTESNVHSNVPMTAELSCSQADSDACNDDAALAAVAGASGEVSSSSTEEMIANGICPQEDLKGPNPPQPVPLDGKPGLTTADASPRARRVLGELRPWKELWRGEVTWACEIWLPEALCHPSLGDRGVPTKPLVAQPIVLGLADDGEISCFMAEAVPLDCEDDEGDNAQLIASFSADSVLRLSTSSTVLDVIGLHIAHNPQGTSAAHMEDLGTALGASATVYLRFDSDDDAASCIQAFVAACRTAAMEESPPPELLEAVVPSSPSDGPDLPTDLSGSLSNWVTFGEEPPEGWSSGTAALSARLPVACGLSSAELELQSRAFLEELDQLAGFA